MNDNLARDEWAAREVGFERPAARRRRAICWQFITTLTLALSTLLAATALTLSYAHADTLSLGDSESASLALAMLLGLVLVGMGGLTAIMARPSRD